MSHPGIDVFGFGYCVRPFLGGNNDVIGQKSRRGCCVGGCSWRRRREQRRKIANQIHQWECGIWSFSLIPNPKEWIPTTRTNSHTIFTHTQTTKIINKIFGDSFSCLTWLYYRDQPKHRHDRPWVCPRHCNWSHRIQRGGVGLILKMPLRLFRKRLIHG